jgi:hypothetical protein
VHVFLSLDDGIFQLFGSDSIKDLCRKLDMEPGEPIEHAIGDALGRECAGEDPASKYFVGVGVGAKGALRWGRTGRAVGARQGRRPPGEAA